MLCAAFHRLAVAWNFDASTSHAFASRCLDLLRHSSAFLRFAPALPRFATASMCVAKPRVAVALHRLSAHCRCPDLLALPSLSLAQPRIAIAGLYLALPSLCPTSLCRGGARLRIAGLCHCLAVPCAAMPSRRFAGHCRYPAVVGLLHLANAVPFVAMPAPCVSKRRVAGATPFGALPLPRDTMLCVSSPSHRCALKFDALPSPRPAVLRHADAVPYRSARCPCSGRLCFAKPSRCFSKTPLPT